MTVERSEARDEETRQKVRALVDRLGVRETATRLGLHRETVLGIVAGVQVRRGTYALVREKVKGVRA